MRNKKMYDFDDKWPHRLKMILGKALDTTDSEVLALFSFVLLYCKPSKLFRLAKQIIPDRQRLAFNLACDVLLQTNLTKYLVSTHTRPSNAVGCTHTRPWNALHIRLSNAVLELKICPVVWQVMGRGNRYESVRMVHQESQVNMTPGLLMSISLRW